MRKYYTRACNFCYGETARDLIFNNKSPKNKKDVKEDEKEKSSALGSLGLKPKPAH